MSKQFKTYRSFKEALVYARTSGITSDIEWHAKADNLPVDIPINPDKVYKEWAGWGYWLGSSKKHPIFLPFKEARKIARSLNVLGRNAYKQLCESGNRPNNIPSRPHLVYPMFKSYEDWTGKAERPKYRSYEEAREFVHLLGIKDWPSWLKFAKSKKCPRDIPSQPGNTYKDKGWVSMRDWLGVQK